MNYLLVVQVFVRTPRGSVLSTNQQPHGPHSLRDVLATHILKATGSYEHAAYSIQNTADTVARHYGRFLPKDKSALAALIVNKVWRKDYTVEFATS